MKTERSLSFAGLLAAGLAALTMGCAAGEMVGKPGSGGSTGGGTGGRTGGGTGGTTTGGGSGGFIGGGTGGTTTGGGTGGFIGGGTGGMVGGGTGGTPGGGAGGAPFMPICTPTAPAISDMEDGNAFYGTSCPKGAWYLSSKTGTVMAPAPFTGTEGLVTPVASDRAPSTKAIHVSGSAQANTTAMSYDAFASLSASLNSPSATQTGAVNATAYTGVKFWGKITGTIKVQVSNSYTHPAGLKCMPTPTTAQCYDHPGTLLAPSTAWMEYTIPFAGLTQEAFGNPSPAAFPKDAIYSIDFKVIVPATGPTAAWDIWVDDLTFY
jgi:hypothetical protein